MSEKIKAVYLDSNGNHHRSKNAAKKANRLIDAADAMSEDVNTAYEGDQSLSSHGRALASGNPAGSEGLIEFARAVVSIYGMKDKAQ